MSSEYLELYVAISLFCGKAHILKSSTLRVFLPPPSSLLLMNILNKTQLLPGICNSLKTTIIRQHELCAWSSEKHSSLLPIGEIKDLGVVTGGKIPYANHCIYVVNIITPTLKALHFPQGKVKTSVIIP